MIMRRKFSNLTMDSLKPKGWWKDYLRVIADGWILRITKLRHNQYYSTFWERNCFEEYPDDSHSEGAGYFADSIIRLALLAPDTRLARELKPWLEQVLASQDENGYLGCCKPEHRWKGRFELWAQDRMLQALLYYYEQTTDRRVLDACLRAARCLDKQLHANGPINIYSRPADQNPFVQGGHTLNIIHPLLKLYDYSGEENLRELAIELHADFDRSGSPFSASAFLAHGATWCHVVTLCEHFSIPISISAVTGDEKFREASLAGIRHWTEEMLQVTGVPTGNELTSIQGPRKYTEHCGVIEWAISCDRILELTGDVRFADMAERAMLNAYPGSKSPDGRTVAYNHAPNEIVAADWAGPSEYDFDQGAFRTHYSMVHIPRCCNGNTSRGWPNYVASAVKTTPDGGVAFIYYGPLVAQPHLPDAGQVRFEEQTNYPFEDDVVIHVHPERDAYFPVALRIPGWCRSCRIDINGQTHGQKVVPGTFHRIERNWQKGDSIHIHFDVPITVDIYKMSWYTVPGVAVVRGPLVFSLPIKEEWIYTGKSPAGPSNIAESWNVLPAKGAAWNYALEMDIRNPELSSKLMRMEVPKDSRPWEHSPMGIAVKARRLPDWGPDTINGKTQTPALPPPPLKPADRLEEIMLVPFGFTRLRMTYLPVLGFEKILGLSWFDGKARE